MVSEASRLIEVIHQAMGSAIQNGAGYRYTPGVISDGSGSYLASAYIETDELVDEIHVPAGAYLQSGDYVIVGISPEGTPSVARIIPYNLYSKLVIDYNRGYIGVGDGNNNVFNTGDAGQALVSGGPGQPVAWGAGPTKFNVYDETIASTPLHDWDISSYETPALIKVFANTGAKLEITGMTAKQDGDIVVIYCDWDSWDIRILSEDVNSAAANRFEGTNHQPEVENGMSATFVYHAGLSMWVPLSMPLPNKGTDTDISGVVSWGAAASAGEDDNDVAYSGHVHPVDIDVIGAFADPVTNVYSNFAEIVQQSASEPQVQFMRALAGPAAVANGTTLGAINYKGYDGTSYIIGATIRATVNGTPGTNDIPTKLEFSTTPDGASTPTLRWTVLETGHLEPNGAMNIGSASNRVETLYAKNISFPATQSASADANTLDDYEEGTWTPTCSFNSPGDTSFTPTTQVGRYTKVGNKVLVAFEVIGTITHSSATGIFRINGLPFSIYNTTDDIYMGSVTMDGFTQAGELAGLALSATRAQTGLGVRISRTGAVHIRMTSANIATGASLNIRGSVEYEVA